MKRSTALQIQYRKPMLEDGKAMWEIAKDSGSLDLNSAYCYLMLGEMFKDSCCIAEYEGCAIAFVSGFHKPTERETLFIWQIAVAKSKRGKGIAKRLLEELLTREENSGVRYIEATIGPDNQASRQLFLRLASELEAECKISELFRSEHFPNSETHSDELLFRIGPLYHH